MNIIITVLWIKKLRRGVVKELVQGGTARKWQGSLAPGLLGVVL